MSSLSAVAARDLPIGTLRASFPTSWPMDRFGALFTESAERNGSSPKGIALSVSEYHGVIPRDDSDGQRASSDVSVYRVLHPGELAVNYMWLNRGGLGVSDLLGYISPAYKVYRIDPSVYPRFAHYLLRSRPYVSAFAALGTGVRPNSQMVDTVELNSLPVPSIPFATQRAIADYLDRETAEIDAMTADLDRMEALLTERRSTSIACSLQSSGGASAPIAAMADVTIGKMVQPNPKNPSEIAAPYLRAAHVPAPGTLDLSVGEKQMWFSPAELGHLTVHAGDVVVVEGGAGYGRAAFVSADLDGWGFQNSIVRVRPREQVAVGKYIAYALQHAQFEGEIELLVSTATLPHFTAEKVERFRLPLPPLEEQRRIVDEIDRETAEIDAMIADITELRDLLAERRAAVIAAAVTGQIDIPTAEEPTHA